MHSQAGPTTHEAARLHRGYHGDDKPDQRHRHDPLRGRYSRAETWWRLHLRRESYQRRGQARDQRLARRRSRGSPQAYLAEALVASLHERRARLSVHARGKMYNRIIISLLIFAIFFYTGVISKGIHICIIQVQKYCVESFRHLSDSLCKWPYHVIFCLV